MSTQAPSSDPTTLGSIPRTGWFNLAWSVAIALFMWALEVAAPGPHEGHSLIVFLAYAISLGYWAWTLTGIVFLAEARYVWRQQPELRHRYLHSGVYGLVRWRTHLLCALVCMPIAAGFGVFLARAVLSLPWPGSAHIGDTLPFGVAMVMTCSIALLTFTLDYMRVRLAANEVRTEAAQRQAVESQLQLLRAQLDPHMMFNTLANLHALIDADPPRAQAMLEHLITFLRATLQGSRALSHPLRDEFARLQDYLALMQIRMGPRLQVEVDLPAQFASIHVPTLLLQPLVENAIKHGLESSRGKGQLTVRARQQDQHLLLDVVNTGRTLSEEDAASSGPGFGLQSVRERLRSAYGQDISLEMVPGPGGEGTRVTVRMPLQTDAPAPAPAPEPSPFGPSRFLP
jgi:Histidine kinase/Histidine kinase-, DNA gyrase B-, and HSP90-like ATPase